MKVSYHKQFDKEGCVYRQTISFKMSDLTLTWLNKKLNELSYRIKIGEVIDGHAMFPHNLRQTITYGKNYLTITQFVAISNLLNFKKSKRIKQDRNTIFYVKPFPKLTK